MRTTSTPLSSSKDSEEHPAPRTVTLSLGSLLLDSGAGEVVPFGAQGNGRPINVRTASGFAQVHGPPVRVL
jgi:hypothetical protein